MGKCRSARRPFLREHELRGHPNTHIRMPQKLNQLWFTARSHTLLDEMPRLRLQTTIRRRIRELVNATFICPAPAFDPVENIERTIGPELHVGSKKSAEKVAV